MSPGPWPPLCPSRRNLNLPNLSANIFSNRVRTGRINAPLQSSSYAAAFCAFAGTNYPSVQLASSFTSRGRRPLSGSVLARCILFEAPCVLHIYAPHVCTLSLCRRNKCVRLFRNYHSCWPLLAAIVALLLFGQGRSEGVGLGPTPSAPPDAVTVSSAPKVFACFILLPCLAPKAHALGACIDSAACLAAVSVGLGN